MSHSLNVLIFIFPLEFNACGMKAWFVFLFPRLTATSETLFTTGEVVDHFEVEVNTGDDIHAVLDSTSFQVMPGTEVTITVIDKDGNVADEVSGFCSLVATKIISSGLF